MGKSRKKERIKSNNGMFDEHPSKDYLVVNNVAFFNQYGLAMAMTQKYKVNWKLFDDFGCLNPKSHMGYFLHLLDKAGVQYDEWNSKGVDADIDVDWSTVYEAYFVEISNLH